MATIRLLEVDNQASVVILYGCMFLVWALDVDKSVVMATSHHIAVDTRRKIGEIMRALTTAIPGKWWQVTAKQQPMKRRSKKE